MRSNQQHSNLQPAVLLHLLPWSQQAHHGRGISLLSLEFFNVFSGEREASPPSSINKTCKHFTFMYYTTLYELAGCCCSMVYCTYIHRIPLRVLIGTHSCSCGGYLYRQRLRHYIPTPLYSSLNTPTPIPTTAIVHPPQNSRFHHY